MDAELARSGLEDQPVVVAGAGVDVREAEHVPEEGSGRVRLVGVEECVAGLDHLVSVSPPGLRATGRRRRSGRSRRAGAGWWRPPGPTVPGPAPRPPRGGAAPGSAASASGPRRHRPG